MGEKRHVRSPGLSRREVVRDALVLAAAGLTAPFTRERRGGGPILEEPFKLGVASGDPLSRWRRAVDPACARPRGRRALGPAGERLSARLGGAGPGGAGRARGQARHRHRRGEKRLRRPRGGNGPAPRTGLRLSLHARRPRDEGVTRTAPAPGDMPESLRFAFCSCAEYENAYHYAYRFMAEREAEAAVHRSPRRLHLRADVRRILSARRAASPRRRSRQGRRCRHARNVLLPTQNRRPASASCSSTASASSGRCRSIAGAMLSTSRTSISRSRTRQCPFIVTWDDHEVDNDYAGGPFRRERGGRFCCSAACNAYRAYFENLPIRLSTLPVRGNGRRLYRHFDFGGLMRLYMLDERQYRSAQACPKSKLEGKGRLVRAGGELQGEIKKRGRQARAPARDAGPRAGAVAGRAACGLQSQLERARPRRDDGAHDTRADCQVQSHEEDCTCLDGRLVGLHRRPPAGRRSLGPPRRQESDCARRRHALPLRQPRS